MQSQPGDEYVRELASYIRSNERGLAESGPGRRTQQRQSTFLSWFSPSTTNASVLLKTDPHHLFYLLIRLEALRLPVGSLDIHVDAPSRPMSYPNIYPEQKNVDATSFSSLRSSFSVVSTFSLGGSWWSQSQPPDIDAELKYIYSCFTKIPALRIGPPSQKVIHELLNDPPDQNAIPLDAFKNLQYLECEDIDPHILLGWDRLAESLRSLKIRNSGLQDVSDIFIAAVHDDQARRQGSASRSRHRNIPHTISEQPNDREEDHDPPLSMTKLSPLKWAFLKHLYLPDNGLAFFPPDLIPHLKSLTHMDLSSNLLVSVPPGFGELYNLVSLNLTDNLIDSVLGIYQNLGQILYINLARNRLDSLCGLERLLALERIDLRYNLLEDSAEIGRLAILPNICELWVDGNPFVDTEEQCRTKCFDYFRKEGKHITLDGTAPTLLERRNFGVQESISIPPFVSSSAPLISVEPFLVAPSHSESLSASNSPQHSPLSPPSVSTGRKKKQKRVVDLNGNTIAENLSQSVSHSRTPTWQSETESTNDNFITEAGDGSIKVEGPPSVPLITVPRRSRHTRYQTEYNPSSPSLSQHALALPQRGQRAPTLSGSATLSSRSDIRRARVSTSVFEPPNSEEWKQSGVDDNAAAYRQKIEVLKRDMGDNWLKVYNQSQPSP